MAQFMEKYRKSTKHYHYLLCNNNPRPLFYNMFGVTSEALPGVFGNRGTRAFISGEQGNKGQILKGTGEQRQYWGTGNITKQIFDFWGTGEQANLFQGNKGTCTPPGRASLLMHYSRYCSFLFKRISIY